MPVDLPASEPGQGKPSLVLGVDTCGSSGSVALGRVCGESVQILSQEELAGRSYSANLVTAVKGLLGKHGASLCDVRTIVAVRGPGSFTGVRVGLSVVKGLAEPIAIPVVAVSRLEVLAWKADAPSSALDAHRREIFLRISEAGKEARELLAGRTELSSIQPPQGQLAVCDEAAVILLSAAWPQKPLLRVDAPTAGDAIQYAMGRVLIGDFADLALLDGHYLRRSDAEIFGEAGANASKLARDD